MTPDDFRDCGGIPPTIGVIPAFFTGIHRDQVMDFWVKAEPFLWRAILLTDGDETLISVRNGLRDGDRQLWMAFEDETMSRALMAVTTRLVQFGSGRRKCEIAQIGGDDMERWLGFLPIIESWAKDQGCSGMRIIGRRGWGRVLSGYRESATVLECVL